MRRGWEVLLENLRRKPSFAAHKFARRINAKRSPSRRKGTFLSRKTYFAAMASISQRTPLGRSFTATQERAGLEVKYLA